MVRIIVSLIDTNKKLFVAMLSKRFGELGGGLAQAGDELKEFGGAGVVDLGELVIADGVAVTDRTCRYGSVEGVCF